MIIQVDDRLWINDRWIDRAEKTNEGNIWIYINHSNDSPYRYGPYGDHLVIEGALAVRLERQWGTIKDD